jgi:hypothetical protein
MAPGGNACHSDQYLLFEDQLTRREQARTAAYAE